MATTNGDDAPPTLGKYGDHYDFERGDWVRTAGGADGIFISTEGDHADIRLNTDKSTVRQPLKDLRHHPDDMQYWRRAGHQF